MIVVGTDAEWVGRATARLDELLIDHAHLEKKAASTALALLFRYPEHAMLQIPLSRLAREELRHFEQVVALLRSRGLSLRPLPPSGYAAALMAIVRRKDPAHLLDALLVAACIEARSCERMRILGGDLADDEPSVSGLYLELVKAEKGHEELYLRFASTLFEEAEVVERRQAILLHEARIVGSTRMVGRLLG